MPKKKRGSGISRSASGSNKKRSITTHLHHTSGDYAPRATEPIHPVQDPAEDVPPRDDPPIVLSPKQQNYNLKKSNNRLKVKNQYLGDKTSTALARARAAESVARKMEVNEESVKFAAHAAIDKVEIQAREQKCKAGKRASRALEKQKEVQSKKMKNMENHQILSEKENELQKEAHSKTVKIIQIASEKEKDKHKAALIRRRTNTRQRLIRRNTNTKGA